MQTFSESRRGGIISQFILWSHYNQILKPEKVSVRKLQADIIHEKVGLKLSIQKTKIMASNPITSWQVDGKKEWKQWQILFSWAPKSLQMVTAAMNLKDTYLLLGRKAMTNLESILKNRDITLLTKVCLVKAMVFPVVIYRCESWTIKKAEHQRTDAFKLWCWKRLLRDP